MAGEIAMDKLMPKPVEITISMRGGGGLSDLNDSININGQPHRLVWANPKEEGVLKDMGGSGKEVLGKPAYFYDAGLDAYPDYNEAAFMDIAGVDPDISITDDTAKLEERGARYAAKFEQDARNARMDEISRRGSQGPAGARGAESTGTRSLLHFDPSRYDPKYPEGPRRDAQLRAFNEMAKTKAGLLGTQATTYGPHGYRDVGGEQDAGARRRYINQHLANFPGGRRDPVTQKLYRADEDYERGIGLAGMGEALRTEYGGQQDIFGAMHKQAASLVQARLNEAINREIELTPEAEQVDSEEYREGIVDAVLSNPATALKEFGLTNVSKSTGLLPEAKVEERGWRDVLGDLATPMAVKVADALSKGIPDLMDIWGTGEVNGRGVYIKKDGTIIPFTSDTERGNIESGSLRGENIDPQAKKLKPRLVQVASAEEVEEPSPLKKLLDARSEVSTLSKEDRKMRDRVNQYYDRDIFSEIG